MFLQNWLLQIRSVFLNKATSLFTKSIFTWQVFFYFLIIETVTLYFVVCCTVFNCQFKHLLIVLYGWLQDHRLDMLCWLRSASKEEKVVEDGTLYSFFRQVYVPFLLNKYTRATVIVVFLGWLCVSLSVLPAITVGLDQELSMPPDSHVHKYFTVSWTPKRLTTLPQSTSQWYQVSLLCLY